eukprot:TRINITY_DN17174_c0_g1_i2.p2 TRINITY_DN17174_c0_g1~~TRINITY_DN17174_c0_g1_i2.p2  ORF type:complete len:227 (+),score=-22.17 TRINITY_DN17174_c0_g1_i2:340-1020(+)
MTLCQHIFFHSNIKMKNLHFKLKSQCTQIGSIDKVPIQLFCRTMGIQMNFQILQLQQNTYYGNSTTHRQTVKNRQLINLHIFFCQTIPQNYTSPKNQQIEQQKKKNLFCQNPFMQINQITYQKQKVDLSTAKIVQEKSLRTLIKFTQKKHGIFVKYLPKKPNKEKNTLISRITKIKYCTSQNTSIQYITPTGTYIICMHIQFHTHIYICIYKKNIPRKILYIHISY